MSHLLTNTLEKWEFSLAGQERMRRGEPPREDKGNSLKSLCNTRLLNEILPRPQSWKSSGRPLQIECPASDAGFYLQACPPSTTTCTSAAPKSIIKPNDFPLGTIPILEKKLRECMGQMKKTLSCGFPSIPGIAPGFAPRIVFFLHCSSRETPFRK